MGKQKSLFLVGALLASTTGSFLANCYWGSAALHVPDGGLRRGGTATVFSVWWYGWVSALFTGAGALPLALARADTWWVGVATAVSAGMMLSASISLVYEGFTLPSIGVAGSTATATNQHAYLIAGILLGLLFFFLISSSFLAKHAEHFKSAGFDEMDAKRALLVIAVMTAHSFAEGLSIGVSFSEHAPPVLGFFITACLATHNVPEGLAGTQRCSHSTQPSISERSRNHFLITFSPNPSERGAGPARRLSSQRFSLVYLHVASSAADGRRELFVCAAFRVVASGWFRVRGRRYGGLGHGIVR